MQISDEPTERGTEPSDNSFPTTVLSIPCYERKKQVIRYEGAAVNLSINELPNPLQLLNSGRNTHSG
jgi:hypothetical protein